jgi:hypothetical protein
MWKEQVQLLRELFAFRLQVVGSGLAPQQALRAPSRHGPYSGNCQKVHRPPVPGSEPGGRVVELFFFLSFSLCE